MNHRMLPLVGALAAALLLPGCFPAVIGAGAGAVMSVQDRRTSGMQIEDEGCLSLPEIRAPIRRSDSVVAAVTISLMVDSTC